MNTKEVEYVISRIKSASCILSAAEIAFQYIGMLIAFEKGNTSRINDVKKALCERLVGFKATVCRQYSQVQDSSYTHPSFLLSLRQELDVCVRLGVLTEKDFGHSLEEVEKFIAGKEVDSTPWCEKVKSEPSSK